jgi:ribosomal protein S18 acetylase RimI-like enzyme
MCIVNLPWHPAMTEMKRQRADYATLHWHQPTQMVTRDLVTLTARPHHALTLANIHSAALPDDYLPSLGMDFLAHAYYPAALQSAYASTLIAVEGTEIVGFVTATHDASRFYRDAVRRNLLPMAWHVICAAWQNARVLTTCFRLLRSVSAQESDPVRGEIVFIAVDEKHRGQGIGKLLVVAATNYMYEKGVTGCRTKTLAHNANAIAMYAHLGWHVRERVWLAGREYVTIVSPAICRRQPVPSV